MILAIGMNSKTTSQPLLPRAWQIFTHIMMEMIRPTTGMRKRMIIQTGILAA